MSAKQAQQFTFDPSTLDPEEIWDIMLELAPKMIPLCCGVEQTVAGQARSFDAGQWAAVTLQSAIALKVTHRNQFAAWAKAREEKEKGEKGETTGPRIIQ